MTPAQQSSVERIGAALAQAGLARLPSRLFAALLVDDDGRMTSAELATALGVSPAAISGAVGYLEQLGMLRRERERGSRRDVYVVDDDAWHGAMMSHDQIYGPIKASLEHSLTALGDDSPAHRRVAMSLDFLRFVEVELDALADKWDKRKAELGY
ncbi:MAG TPA: MarR family transcriptional regulator [Nocardioides sp.]|uniref:GbsR/MarR family transcriptional regulator n=1 Tax=Nocardioides sp. TaxID=35761 RepID=UPI002E37DF1D|nr:MarR family transcriptional regulator [Nocardioides sp.]HEX5088797.1 MarR family transcriptional regulator [Nocardioides sp.]